MEARLSRAALLAAIVCSLGASHRTRNFIVTAPSLEFARQVGESAETFRRDLALEWLGKELPAWQDPCPIRVDVGAHLGAGGATSFMFDQGRPFGWTMSIQGSRERILDSVLPHEITHTIFATHFGRPLPRWADEGACTTVEDISERSKQHRLLIEFLTTDRGIAFNKMFAMKDYPRDILPLYAQGYSLARFMLDQGGKQKFIQYVGDGMNTNNWTAATHKHYGYKNLSELQVTWLDWVRRGSPPLKSDPQLASANAKQSPYRLASAGASRDAQANDSNDSWTSVPSEPSSDEPRGIGASNSATSNSATSNSATGDFGLGQPRAGEPATTVMSSADSELAGRAVGSWYARQRKPNETAPRSAQVSELGPSNRMSVNASSARSVAPPAEPPTVQSVTRPQPVGRTRQVILEWSRGGREPSPAYGAGAAHPMAPSGGTVWR